MIYEVENLRLARKFLAKVTASVILSNTPGSVSYYGMRVINYIFMTLKEEFPDKISGFIVNVYDN